MKSLVVLLAFVVSLPAFAAEPPTAPHLQLELGMQLHSNAIATDANGRFVLTCGDDGTGRLWDAHSSQLLHVYRVPLGKGFEGHLISCALSPDGTTIALSGFTGWEWDGSISIYIFDRVSGEMTHRLSGLPDNVHNLAFSPDGNWLVAGMNGKAGIRAWRTDTWVLSGSDTENYDGGTDLVFGKRDGHQLLATVGSHGKILLYEVDSQLELLSSIDSNKRGINSLSFSADGKLLAVASVIGPEVNVYSVSDDGMSLAYKPSVVNSYRDPMMQAVYDKATHYSVQFSKTDNKLYGFFSLLESNLRSWQNFGAGGYSDSKVELDSTYKLVLAFPDGTLGFLGHNSWSRIDPRRAPSLPKVLGLSGVKAEVRDYITADSEPSGFESGWDFNFAVGAGGLDVILEKKADGTAEAFSLSARGYITRTSKDKDSAYAANGVDDAVIAGQLKVKAEWDGTISWSSASSGKLLLTLFPHPDGKRWILWTPSGYYDCSPGGEDLIGWQVNNGKDHAAEFYPASRFRSTFYRPDVVSLVLSTLDEAQALAAANAAAGGRQASTSVLDARPPTVTITSPDQGSVVSSAMVTLRYRLKTPDDAPVTSVKALVDGRPLEGARGITVVANANVDQSIDVGLPGRDCTVSLIAENKNGSSVAESLRLVWKGAQAAQDQFVILPKLYVLAVGVSAYQNPDYQLKYSAKDAKDLAALLSKGGPLYRGVETKVLTDAGADKDDILDGLDWIQKQTTSKDIAVILFSGHGINDSNGNYYYLPVNADIDKLKRTGVAFSDIKTTVSAIAGKVLVFIDTCHSGDLMAGRRAAGAERDIGAVINELASAENGAIVFSSSTGSQYSYEDPAWGNGAFTKALLEGLEGKAAVGESGRVTINMLDLYLSERVKELTGGKQTPTTTKPPNVPDFPIAIRP